ncbi:MAG: hypothetical protein Q8P84_03310 [Deltaproteobacteria bacterium]|nr:hypothetical protein [Deltaproteobacteria bacterium]
MTLLFSLSPVFAGGPYQLGSSISGQPPRWPYHNSEQKYVVKWKADGGRLNSRVSRETAIGWVEQIFDKWKAASLSVEGENAPVATTALKSVPEGDGNVGVDITKENYEVYVHPEMGSLVHATIIFDEDGSIITALSNGDELAKGQIVGYGSPILDGSAKTVIGGFVVLNGLFVNGQKDLRVHDNEISPEDFKAVILHEIGHMLNLDHSAVNQNTAMVCVFGESCDNPKDIPTMWPELLTGDQYGLHHDDIVTVSWLYPSKAFNEKFCKAMGSVKNKKKNEPMAGVHVVGEGVGNPAFDARGMVSGVLYPESVRSPNGDYILAGLSPKKEYEIRYEELPYKEVPSGDGTKTNKYSIASGFEPLTNPPRGFGGGDIRTIRCESGGETINLPVAAVVFEEDKPIGQTSESPGTESTKGWCALTSRGSSFTLHHHAVEIFGIFGLFVLLLWRFGAREKSFSRFIRRPR